MRFLGLFSGQFSGQFSGRNLIILLAFLTMPFSAMADDALKTPRPDIAPIDVVRIQLEALKNNDSPSPDLALNRLGLLLILIIVPSQALLIALLK